MLIWRSDAVVAATNMTALSRVWSLSHNTFGRTLSWPPHAGALYVADAMSQSNMLQMP
jgi:hypothetical protein